MIYVVNEFDTDRGKKPDAVDFLKRLATYNNDHDVGCEVLSTMTGRFGDLMLLHRYDSVEHWGKYLKTVKEPAHKALIDEYKNEGYFPGGYERHIWNIVDLDG